MRKTKNIIMKRYLIKSNSEIRERKNFFIYKPFLFIAEKRKEKFLVRTKSFIFIFQINVCMCIVSRWIVDPKHKKEKNQKNLLRTVSWAIHRILKCLYKKEKKFFSCLIFLMINCLESFPWGIWEILFTSWAFLLWYDMRMLSFTMINGWWEQCHLLLKYFETLWCFWDENFASF